MFKSIVSMFTGNKENNTVESSRVVCQCMNITENDIRNAINNGANSFEEVQKITKVSTGCGKCTASNTALVNEMLLNKKIDENQVVCGCFNVKVQDFIKAIKNGARSFEEVQAVTKAGTGCGGCVESNKALVAQLLTIY